MKTKILLIFVLFTISLFGQFKEERNGFTIKTTDYYKKMTCTIKAVNNTLIIYIDSKEEPTSISFGNYNIFIKNSYLDFFMEMEEVESYRPKNLTKLVFKEKNLYYILLSQKYFVEGFLQAIVKGRDIFISAGEMYMFEFDEYVLNIIESDFYKEVMQ